MHARLTAIPAALGVVALSAIVAVAASPDAAPEQRPAMRPLSDRTFHGGPGDLAGVGPTVQFMETAWFNGVHDRNVRILEETAARERAARAAASRRVATSSSGYSSGASSTGGGGSCQAMKPAGFPDYIIQRESGGNPNARNPSGAYGCVQMLPGHLTGNYAADWARLWNDGAGACNWDPPNYCAG